MFTLHHFRDSCDKKSEAKAASALGNVHNKMSDNHAALQFHQLDLDISSTERNESNGDLDYLGQIRALRNLGATSVFGPFLTPSRQLAARAKFSVYLVM